MTTENGTEFADQLSGGTDNDTLNGFGGDDDLFGDAGSDELNGGSGDDRLNGGLGSDILTGGSGVDNFWGTPDELDGDRITDYEDGERITVSATTLVASNVSLLPGPTGSTIIELDTTHDGSSDTFLTLDGDFTVAGLSLFQDFGDTVITLGFGETFEGTPGEDQFFGTGGNDTINGGDGFDSLSGDAGDDVINGGAQHDFLGGDDGNDILNGGSGVDYLHGGRGADTLTGGADGDNFNGNLFDFNGDRITDFEVGLDTIEIHQALSPGDITVEADRIRIATGDPFHPETVIHMDVDVSGLTPNISLSSFGNTFITFGAGLTITGTDASETFEGGFNDDVANLGGGNDFINANGGDDTVNGEGGDDILNGGSGVDTLTGGEGFDQFEGSLYEIDGDTITDYEVSRDRIFIFETVGPEDITVEAGLIRLNHPGDPGFVSTLNIDAGVDLTTELLGVAESEFGGTFIYFGSFDADLGDGDDFYIGGPGDDVINGGGGIDTLFGGFGDDTINGGEGSDFINGDLGADTLTGGPGLDRFQGDARQFDGDTITDYEDGELIEVFGVSFTADDVTITEGSTVIDVDVDQDDVIDMTLTLAGDFTDANLSVSEFFGSTVFSLGFGSTIDGTPGDDPNLAGTGGNDIINGLDGNDVLFGGSGDDLLNGGPGADTLDGGFGADELDGGSGADVLSGQEGDDFLVGGDGFDRLFGQLGADVSTGGAGIDWFEDFVWRFDGDTITDFADGERIRLFNADFASVENSLNVIGDTVSFTAETEFGVEDVSFTLLGSYNRSGLILLEDEFGAPTLTVPVPLSIDGTEADETVVGGVAGDTLDGKGGDDFVFGSLGIDTLTGGDGQDGFSGTAAGLDGDTITDFAQGEQIFVFSLLDDFQTTDLSLDVEGSLVTVKAPDDTPLFAITLLGTADLQALAIIDGGFGNGLIGAFEGPQLFVEGGDTIAEGDDGITPFEFTVVRTGDLSGDLEVTYDLVPNEDPFFALDSDDIVGTLPLSSQTIIIPEGERTGTITIEIVGDEVIEPFESLDLQITEFRSSTGVDYNLLDTGNSLFVLNDDGRPPVIPQGVSAGVFGDPHLITLDGLGYSFQAVGEYILAETSDPFDPNPFQVQVRFEPVEGSDLVSVTTRVAVEIGGKTVEIDAFGDTPLLIDGVPTPMGSTGSIFDIDDDGILDAFGTLDLEDLDGDGTLDPGADAGGLGAGDVFFTGDQFILVLNDLGEQVRISLGNEVLNVDLFIDQSHEGGVRGLLGNANGDTGDDLRLRDGSDVTRDPETGSVTFDSLYGEYADSWRLDGTSPDKLALFTNTVTFPENFPLADLGVDALPEDLVNAAERAARDAGVPEELVEAAALDFILTGDEGFLEGAVGVSTTQTDEAETTGSPVVPTSVGIVPDSLSITEGDTGSQIVMFDFYRIGDDSAAVEIDFAIGGDVNTADLAEGTLLSGQVMIASGETSASLSVEVSGDLDTEGDEALTVSITAAALQGTGEEIAIAGARATTSILTDDSPPDAVDDRFTIDQGEAFSGNVLDANPLSPDSDIDGDSLSVVGLIDEDGRELAVGTEVGLPSGASLTVDEDGSFSYTPGTDFDDLEPGALGDDRFRYVVSDGNGGVSIGEVVVTVRGATTEVEDLPDGPGDGTNGDDVLVGSEGDDTFNAFAGDDDLSGLGGNDLLRGGTGADTMAGGLGDDRYQVDSPDDVVVENADEGTDRVDSTIDYRLGDHVEQLVLQGSDDLDGFGNGLNNKIAGNRGDNTLYGYDGDDILNGFDGNDVLNGGGGRDFLVGGLGDDTYIVDDSLDRIRQEKATEDGGGDDKVNATVSFTLPSHVETLALGGTAAIDGTGGDTDNSIIGNNADNTLRGMGGNDKLNGNGGDDTLEGGDGKDFLNGGAGADILIGGDGGDRYTITDATDTVIEWAGDSGTDIMRSSVDITIADNVERLVLIGTALTAGGESRE
ncbi:MAG: Ig-like domain-containing protein, partial [Pseudomonadota bacterium]